MSLQIDDFFSIPIFVISFNRKDTLKKCIERYEKDGYKNIIVIDNASTNNDVLDYLKSIKHKVYFLEKNYGHHVLWLCGLFQDIILNQYYVLTDPDVVPIEECPKNYVEVFYKILVQHPEKTKVGFALKLDDIPFSYKYKIPLTRYESFYWEKVISDDPVVYDAPLDTTFALYRPGEIPEESFFCGLRTGYPYVARHLGWYVNLDAASKKNKSYYNKNNMISTSSSDKSMKAFQYEVCARIYEIENDNFFCAVKSSIHNKFLLENTTYIQIIKLSIYLICKRIAIKLNMIKFIKKLLGR